jgi:hypothetical protein
MTPKTNEELWQLIAALTYKILRLQAKSEALTCAFGFLVERVGVPKDDLLKTIEQGVEESVQKQLESLENIDPEIAAWIDKRANPPDLPDWNQ